MKKKVERNSEKDFFDRLNQRLPEQNCFGEGRTETR
jgi:hypothetical protein